MIDQDLHPYLLEVTINGSLGTHIPLKARMIPELLESMFQIVVDPLFPPPPFDFSKDHKVPDVSANKFELIFNERTDGA